MIIRLLKLIFKPFKVEFPPVGSVWVEKRSDPFELRTEMYERPVHVIECAGSYVNVRIGRENAAWRNIRYDSMHLWAFRENYIPIEYARKRLERRGIVVGP